jgi:hypothetical protein
MSGHPIAAPTCVTPLQKQKLSPVIFKPKKIKQQIQPSMTGES